jgi:hypothetical protein
VEERLQRLDLIAVLFDELPALIIEHIDGESCTPAFRLVAYR